MTKVEKQYQKVCVGWWVGGRLGLLTRGIGTSLFCTSPMQREIAEIQILLFSKERERHTHSLSPSLFVEYGGFFFRGFFI